MKGRDREERRNEEKDEHQEGREKGLGGREG